MSEIPDNNPSSKEIRTNHRFSTFEGLSDKGERVFIKTAVDPKLRERLDAEARGLEEFLSLDPNQTLFRVPRLIDLTGDRIVTTWAEGTPMAKDFEGHDETKIEQDVQYLTRLYAFVDQNTQVRSRMGDMGDRLTDKHMTNLRKLQYDKHVDAILVTRIAEYIRAISPSTETRATNGDLQPGNILVADNAVPTLIDFETYRDSWPRHYNIVNFIFNYGANYPKLSGKFRDMLVEYEQATNVSPGDDIASFNISAAIRSLQMIEERIPGGAMSLEVKNYIETSMRNILSGRLFND